MYMGHWKLSSRSDLAGLCDFGEKCLKIRASFNVIDVQLWWSAFCKCSYLWIFCFQRQRKLEAARAEKAWRQQDWFVQSICSLIFMHTWVLLCSSSLRFRCIEAVKWEGWGRWETRVYVGAAFLSVSWLKLRLATCGDHIICCPKQNPLEDSF